MGQSTKAIRTTVIAGTGALLCFALAFYPFNYNLVESLLLTGALVGAALFRTVLDEPSF
jgi:hypothetical protein